MRPTFAQIDLHAVNTNLKQIRKIVGKQPLIMAMVKGNAYGHGMIPVAQSIFRSGSAQYFGVAIVEEGIELRKAKIKLPILVLTSPHKEQLALFARYSLETTICDLSTACALNNAAGKLRKTVPVHIKIDTGMGRIGVSSTEAVRFVEKILTLPNLIVKGIWTHFASSDERDLRFAHEQLKNFRSIVTTLELKGIHIPLVHCANSGAILQMPDSYFDMVRPGIMIYGYTPAADMKLNFRLLPALDFISRVGFLKCVGKGTSISYGRRYYTRMPSTIASITVGYADGYFRTLTNKAFVLIRGKKYPVAGTVCMDQIMADTGSNPVRVGDEVVLIGKRGKEVITAWDIAKAAGTIPYEVTTAISQRVPRVYIYGK